MLVRGCGVTGDDLIGTQEEYTILPNLKEHWQVRHYERLEYNCLALPTFQLIWKDIQLLYSELALFAELLIDRSVSLSAGLVLILAHLPELSKWAG